MAVELDRTTHTPAENLIDTVDHSSPEQDLPIQLNILDAFHINERDFTHNIVLADLGGFSYGYSRNVTQVETEGGRIDESWECMISPSETSPLSHQAQRIQLNRIRVTGFLAEMTNHTHGSELTDRFSQLYDEITSEVTGKHPANSPELRRKFF